MSEIIGVGDSVVWESQAMGVWKRKIGTVVGETEKNYIVEVDTIVGYEDGEEVGERKVLKKPKRYSPKKSICRRWHYSK